MKVVVVDRSRGGEAGFCLGVATEGAENFGQPRSHMDRVAPLTDPLQRLERPPSQRLGDRGVPPASSEAVTCTFCHGVEEMLPELVELTRGH